MTYHLSSLSKLVAPHFLGRSDEAERGKSVIPVEVAPGDRKQGKEGNLSLLEPQSLGCTSLWAAHSQLYYRVPALHHPNHADP